MSKTLEQAIHERRRILGNQYAYLAELEEMQEMRDTQHNLENPYAFASELDQLAAPIASFDGIDVSGVATTASTSRKSAADIELLTRQIHAQIWIRRADLFTDFNTRKPVDFLDPIAALRLLGYSVDVVGALGQIADSGRHASNVAGLIDNRTRQVQLSSALAPVVRNYTAAHELGHAVMHKFAGMHRDRSMDGSKLASDYLEREADQFAALFLMPAKLLKQLFERTFGLAPFELNEETRFALAGSLPSDRWSPKNLRDLSRLLSSATRFNGVSFTSLADQFHVSREAMAIRLEQLKLVLFN